MNHYLTAVIARSRRNIASLMGMFTLLATSTASIAQTESTTDLTLRNAQIILRTVDGSEIPLDVGCSVATFYKHGVQLFVGCQHAQIVVVSLSDPQKPVVTSQQRVQGTISGFFETDGVVWAKVNRVEAFPVEPIAGTPIHPPPQIVTSSQTAPHTSTPSAPTVSTRAPMERTGRILEINIDEVLIDLGSEDGLNRGDHVEIYVNKRIQMGSEDHAERAEILAVGVVSTISASRARVHLGMNETVPLQALVRKTNASRSESKLAPPRVSRLFDVTLNLRPFLPLDTLGFGAIMDLFAVYRFQYPFAVRVMLDPLAFGFAKAGDIASFSGAALGTLDLQLFEIGAGVGVSTVNRTIDHTFAFTTSTVVRLGARDGLNVEIRNAIVFFDEKFHYGATSGSGQIPISSKWWILLRGGGGNIGYVYGEAGLRVRMKGNGHRDSLFLNAGAGWASISQDRERINVIDNVPYPYLETVSYHGPMLSVGVEWRP